MGEFEMSYQTPLSSSFNNTKNRSARVSPQSGMCSMCTEDCTGTCEIALAAVLGAQTVYPTTTGANQIASEKNYPIDFSHFNINGRVFGAQGVRENYAETTIFNVSLARSFGVSNQVKMELPVILPALIKLDWEDYFAGAAMAGVCCVIGENSASKDPGVEMTAERITSFPMLEKIIHSFYRYDRGFGQIVLQCNVEDDITGLPEYALSHGVEAIEFKFGQSAKGTQPVNRLNSIEEALKKQAAGALVHPDPSDPEVQLAYAEGRCPNFYAYGRLPLWDETHMASRIKQIREIGAKNVYFKMAGFDPADLERVLRMASICGVDFITFDGAGGGSGYSPCKMMNEWALPTICMEDAVVSIAKKLKAEGKYIPAISITGGLASEDQVFKALAYGDGFVTAVGLCRASMAAAMSAKRIGSMIQDGKVPELFRQYGNTVESVFADLPDLRALYGTEANNFPTGAIGVFSYLNKIAFGLRHFAALNRKFNIDLLDRSDLIPLTGAAKELVCGKWFDYRTK